MTVLRIVAYAILGGLVTAAVLAGLQLYIFNLAHADIAAIPLPTLLVEQMELPRYALMGTVLGLLVAPFPGRTRHPVVRLLGWTSAGVLVGLASPLVRHLLGLHHLPTVDEVAGHFAVDPRALVGGAAAGFVLSWVETIAEAFQRWRVRRRAAPTRAGGLNDVDATLKAYWRDRADAYLAHREHRE